MIGMDFGALPPEVTSARMYAGPGAGPMLAAAAAWSLLAAELSSAARTYTSVIAGLTGEGWSGPAAEAMAVAVAPYLAWLGATAEQARQTASQAAAAASAFMEAYAATVPPPMIVANRSELTSLAATNVFGQHSAAIAALEAEYGQMWTRDAGMMYTYAGRSAAASAVTPFTDPPSTTTSGGLAGQTAVIQHAASSGIQSQLSQLINAMPRALNGLGSAPGIPASPAAGTVEPLQSVMLPSPTQAISYVESVARSVLVANDANISVLYGQGQFARNLSTDLDFAEARYAVTAAQSAGVSGAVVGPAGVGLGKAASVGKLAVPAVWMAATPAVTISATALSGAGSGAAAAAAVAPGALAADIALAGLAGRTIAGTAIPGRPAAAHTQTQLESLAGELTGTREVQHWHARPGAAESPFAELSKRPGVHTVHLDTDCDTSAKPGPPSGRG